MRSGAFGMNKKRNVVLDLDNELVEKSNLKQLILQLSNNQSTHNNLPSENKTLWWAGPDSDRRPSAHQADVLTWLDKDGG